MPALSIDDRALSSNCTSPHTPLGDFDGLAFSECGSSLPSESFEQYALQQSPAFGGRTYTFPAVQAPQPQLPLQPAFLAPSSPAVELDWWSFRHVKVSLDEEGIPLEELLLNLQEQQLHQVEQQHFVRQ